MGQAAVDASIVSPILIIIVSTTAICSFTVPDFSLSFHLRIAQFVYIILGSMAGFLGISAGLAVHILIVCTMKSFGVPYVNLNLHGRKDSELGLFISSICKRENRSEFLKTKRPKSQDQISMAWKYHRP